jgi:hypothetical protein
MHAPEIERFLSHLVSTNNVSVATQKQALLRLSLPTVLVQNEVQSLLGELQGTPR